MKPGDVVAVEHLGRTVRGIVDVDGRFYTTDQSMKGVPANLPMRPLAVIDPLDSDQVERVADIVTQQLTEDDTNEGITSAVRGALEEYVKPAPEREWRDGDVVVSSLRAYHRHDGRWWPTRPSANSPEGYSDADMDEMLAGPGASVLREQAAAERDPWADL